MAHFVHLLHTLQGTLNSMEGNFLVNDQGDFIIDHNDNVIEVVDEVPPPPTPPWGDPRVVPIGNFESTTDYYLPTYNYYCYSLTQQIYTAAEINFTGYITGIVFYPRGTCDPRKLSVYISPFSTTAFQTSDSVVLDQSNQVMAPTTVTITANTLLELQFDTPYYYDGTSNILITVQDTTGEYDSSIVFDTFSTGLYQALYNYTDSYPGYSPLEENSLGSLDYKNSVKLLFNNATPYDPEPEPEVPTGPGVILLGTNYQATTNYNVPVKTDSKYSLSEQRFTKSEIHHAGTITDVSFRASDTITRNISIYFALSNNDEVRSSSEWLEDGTLVFSGSVNFVDYDTDGWTTIHLTHPYEYACDKTLIITTVDNTGSVSASLAFDAYTGDPATYAAGYNNNASTQYAPLQDAYPITMSQSRNVLMLVFDGDPSRNFVHIGSHDYPYTQIGNRLWTTVNLYEPLGTFGNTTGTDSCWVDFETDSEKGMMYALRSMVSGATARTELEAMLPTGWRIPTPNDFNDLKVASNSDWRKLTVSEYGGTNELGFGAQLMTPMATDHTSPDDNPLGRNKVSKFVMVNSNSYNEFELYHVLDDEQFVMFYDNPAWRICIRVCKDV